MSWGFIGGLASAAASVYSTRQNNKNIDKQLAAQAEENSKTREYNLELAKLQNKWNVQQWNNENAYNSPTAQIERMREAGLNPDMMYGGGVSGNLSASSPSMTSGAAASPMDFSSLANKKTVFDAALQTAQLNQINAQTDKIKSETQGVDIDNKYKPLEKELGLQLTDTEIRKNKATIDNIIASSEKIKQETLNLSVDMYNKLLDYVVKSNSVQSLIRKAAAEADIAEAQAEVEIKTKLARITSAAAMAEKAGYEAGAAKAKKELAEWETSTAWVDLTLKCLDRGIKIFDVALDFRNLKDFFKAKSKSGDGTGGSVSPWSNFE